MLLFADNQAVPPHYSLIIGGAIGSIIFIAIVARIIALLRFVIVRIKLRSDNTVISEYDPPMGLTAVELGYLFDNRFSDNELLAGCVSLMQRDMLTIGQFKNGDFVLATTPEAEKNRSKIDGADAAILAYILSFKQPAHWSQISSATSEFVGMQESFEREVLNDLGDKGVLNDAVKTRIFLGRSVIAHIISIVLAVIITGLPLRWVMGSYYSGGLKDGFVGLDKGLTLFLALPLLGVAYLISLSFVGLLAHIYYRSAGIPAGATDDLKRLWPEIAGFREFIKTVEYNRLLADPSPKDASLPYCLALGLDPGFRRGS